MSADLGAELVAGLYEAAFRPAYWPEATERIARAFDAGQAVIAWIDRRSDAPPVMNAYGIGADDLRCYTPDLWADDPRGQFLRTAPAGELLISGRNDDPERVYASEAGKRYYRKRVRAYWLAGVIARNSADSHLGFAVQRPPALGMFSAEQIDAVRAIGGHIDHVMRLASRNDDVRVIDALRNELLDSLPCGVVLVDRRGLVAECNAAARTILERRDGVVMVHNRLAAVTVSDTVQLQRLVGSALARNATGIPEPGGTMRVGRIDGSAPYLVSVMPSRLGDLDLAQPPGGAVVMLRDPMIATMPDPERLRAAYGLTAAEARLAAQLMIRPGLVVASREIGIAHETARQHLKRLLQKTGCRSQNELVAMLASDLALLPRGGG